MDGSPQLLTDVKFTKLKRGGYDPDQVDNFLERVSVAVSQLQDKLRQATERAESADAQVAEARRQQSQPAPAAVVPAEPTAAPQPDASEVDTDGELSKVLVLAQRAADQAVAEANTTATRTVADARAKAVNLLAEAERDRDEILAAARAYADSDTVERAKDLQAQVATLDTARAELENDVAALDEYLAGERARLHEQLDVISAMLDNPTGLVVADLPELANPVIPEIDLGPTKDPVTDVATESALTEADSTSSKLFGDSADAAGSTDMVGGDTGPATELFTVPDVDEPAASADVAAAPVVAPVVAPPLGEPDAAADEAMRAFFEQDLADEVRSKQRFGRRR